MFAALWHASSVQRVSSETWEHRTGLRQNRTRARNAREEQDYDLDAAPLTVQDAERIVADAEHFVTRLERYLREVGALD